MSEGLHLEYPVAVGNSTRERYHRNGIIFTGRTGKGYTRLNPAYNLTEADFASLSERDLFELVPHLNETKYAPVIDMATRIQDLVKQAKTVNRDGFPFPTHERPFTWPMHSEIANEIGTQLGRLEATGIKEVKIGLEMEFSCDENAINGFTHWQNVKDASIANITQRIEASSSEPERELSQKKLEDLSKFNAREILMYDMVELDSKTRDLLEPIFGQGHDGDGYYDASDVLELKLKAVDPLTAMNNRKIILQTLYDKSVEYGLEITSKPGFHVNVSFWDDEGNILDDKHSKFRSLGKEMSQGIAKAFYDSIFVLLDDYSMNKDNLIKFGLYAHRENLLRFSGDRIEVRPSAGDSQQDTDMMISILLAGAIFGASGRKDIASIPAIEVKSPVVHHPKDRLKVVAHLIGNSVLKPDGFLDIPEEYVNDHDDMLEYELGITNELPPQTMSHSIFKLLMMSDFTPFLVNFFKSTKIEKGVNGEMSVKFPETSEGIYEFTLPSINLDKLPPELQERVKNGEELEHEELSKYIMAGDRIPKPERKYKIDIKRLESSLNIVSLKSKFIVPGYNLNKAKNIGLRPKYWTKMAWARYKRLGASPELKFGLSNKFHTKLCELAKIASKTKEAKVFKKLSTKDVIGRLLYKVKDADYVYETKSKSILNSWMYRGLVEGRDFLKKSVKIEFEGVHDPHFFRRNLIYFLGDLDINPYQYLMYFTDHREYSNGTNEVILEMDPRFIPILAKIDSQKVLNEIAK